MLWRHSSSPPPKVKIFSYAMENTDFSLGCQGKSVRERASKRPPYTTPLCTSAKLQCLIYITFASASFSVFDNLLILHHRTWISSQNKENVWKAISYYGLLEDQEVTNLQGIIVWIVKWTMLKNSYPKTHSKM